MVEIDDHLKSAAEKIRQSRYTTAFTGAGISVESGIPPFRGAGGLWNKYNPEILEINYFKAFPLESWQVIKEIFYDFFTRAIPNPAHLLLARMEKEGMLAKVITQNIDNLHQEAGNKQVFDFHGNSKKLICMVCHRHYPIREISFDHLPPTCRECGGLLKPDFIFFGEGIPSVPLTAAYEAAELSDVFLLMGTTGEVSPANHFPPLAKANGAVIIEVNPEPSLYTDKITDIFLRGKAGEVMAKLSEILFPPSLDDDQDGID